MVFVSFSARRAARAVAFENKNRPPLYNYTKGSIRRHRPKMRSANRCCRAAIAFALSVAPAVPLIREASSPRFPSPRRSAARRVRHSTAARAERHRPRAVRTHGVRCAGEDRGRRQHRPGEGRRHQGAMTSKALCCRQSPVRSWCGCGSGNRRRCIRRRATTDTGRCGMRASPPRPS
jgi:hypothetical protein